MVSSTGDDQPTTVLGSGRSTVEDALPGATVGRYVVIDVVGRGGAGTVLRAYDPRLYRELAIKRLRADSRMPENAERFVREARAMARLSHPNVVSVFDVEEHDGEVIIAMEYVAGPTLREHVRKAKPPLPWRTIVELYRKAGRGLAAAHATGLVHRDFKPSNVLVTEQGLVKVGDFGLAKTSAEATVDPAGLEMPAFDEVEGDDSLVELTRHDTILGTPRYMAPEQHARDRLTPAADQYSFCVSLWEALVGEPPFPDTDLVRAKLAGPPSWPAEVAVPPRIVSAVCRGLSPTPAQRWSGMAELLDALDFDPHTQRRRRVVLGATGLVLALGVAGWQVDREARRRQCTREAEELAARWNDDVRQQVRSAFSQSGAPAAEETARNTIEWIDRFAGQWEASVEQTCLAYELDGSLTKAAVDRRRACSAEQRHELAGFLSLVETLDASHLAPLSEAAAALGPPARCEDDALLARLATPPDDGARRAEHDELQAAVFRARLLAEIDREGEALDVLNNLEARLEQPGLESLHAEATRVKGHALWTEVRADRAVDAFHESLALALAVDDDLTAARSANDLARILTVDLGKYDEAGRWLSVARALAGGDGADAALEVAILVSEASRLRLSGRTEEARQAAVDALAAATSTLGADHPKVGDVLNQLAIVEGDLGQGDSAIAHLERTLELWRRVYGESSVSVSLAYANLGIAYNKMGQQDQALQYLETSVEVGRRVLRPTHPEIAYKLSNTATLAMQMGRLELAREYGQEAAEACRLELGLDDPKTSFALTTLGRIYDRLGDTERARAALEDALKATELDTLSRVRTEISLSAVYRGEDDQRALEYAQAAWERLVREGREEPAVRAGTLTAVSRANRRLGHHERALEQALRAIDYDVEAFGVDSRQAATAEVDVIRCLADLERWQQAIDRLEAFRASVRWQRISPTSQAQLDVIGGDCRRELGDVELARTAYRRAAEEFEAADDSQQAAIAMKRLGDLK